ncbi:MAG: ThuA domain-containing protein [Phycisphaerales bacterium]|jgi:putative membrane-bound dehydrogenase-like protein|nr:ThuA domain-containing protein [Phycisphaerales bacterium]
MRTPIVPIAAVVCLASSLQADTRIHALFLGDRAYHEPEARLHEVWGSLARKGITLDWEEDLRAVTPELLSRYDCVVMYANHPELAEVPPTFLSGLDAYIRSGGGFAALHCTSGCFPESPAWANLIGARFESHGAEVFSQQVVDPSHPIVREWAPFETWDETYVQTHVADNRTVLTTRGDEPWCWVRGHGDGRIFYTASGHDGRTWADPAWPDHLGRAIRWASGDTAADRHDAFTSVPFSFEPHAWVPNYEGADPPPPLQSPSTPAQAVDALIVPAGFRAELFAAEPMVVNPIAMTWDQRGRCWVIESPDYPNDVRPDGVGKDRISVLEDVDGDGRADTKTVFAEHLNLPTGLLVVTGGLVVAAPPDLLLYEDLDGDDRADRRETLFTGFGTWDTHAGPSNLSWGPDNAIWGAVGYAGFERGGITFGPGLWRWNQTDPHPELMSQFSNNTWGLGFRSDGEVFGSTANGAPSFFAGATRPELASSHPDHPAAAYVSDSNVVHPAVPSMQQGDFHGAFTAAAGHRFATGTQVPAHWLDRMAFICEPTARLVGRQDVVPDGAGFRARDCFNLVASTDGWFCPVQAEVGPDGAIWVADLAQFVVLHNLPGDPERGLPSVSFGPGNAHLNPLRDRDHGRIYRITRTENRETPDLSDPSLDALMEALDHPNRFWRTTARRLLVEGLYTEAADALHARARGGEDRGAAEAIRTLHGIGLLGGHQGSETLRTALNAPGPAARHAALACLPQRRQSADLLLASNALHHESAATRRHAYRAAARLPESPALGAALAGSALAESLEDPWLAVPLGAAAAQHANACAAALGPAVARESAGEALLQVMDLVKRHAGNAPARTGARTIALAGGDAEAGRQVFERHAVAACTRCHSMSGGAERLGPDLSQVGARLTAEQILESILDPNAAMADGWPHPRSAMPALSPFLSDEEVRDLVAYLTAAT